MNTPSVPENNWTWRFHTQSLHPDLAIQLRHITEECDRDAYIPDEILVEEAPAPPQVLSGQTGEQQGTAPAA